VRGNVPAPAPGEQPPQYQIIERLPEHSRKPGEFVAMIDRLFPGLAKLEMYGRGKPPPGWDSWGNEVDTPESASEPAAIEPEQDGESADQAEEAVELSIGLAEMPITDPAAAAEETAATGAINRTPALSSSLTSPRRMLNPRKR
jgi:hypothetical protein